MDGSQADNFNKIFVNDYTKGLKSATAQATGSVKKAMDIALVQFGVISVQQSLNPNSGDPMASMAQDADEVAAVCKASGSPIHLLTFKKGG